MKNNNYLTKTGSFIEDQCIFWGEFSLSIAIDVEVELFLTKQPSELVNGKKRLVRNGFLPPRLLRTSYGPLKIRIPKVKDRKRQGVKFNSMMIPPYLKRSSSPSISQPAEFLNRVVNGDVEYLLTSLLGESAKTLPAEFKSELFGEWRRRYQAWTIKNLSPNQTDFVRYHACAVQLENKSENTNNLLVLIGFTEESDSKPIILTKGDGGSIQQWNRIFAELENRGLVISVNQISSDPSLGVEEAINVIFNDKRAETHESVGISQFDEMGQTV